MIDFLPMCLWLTLLGLFGFLAGAALRHLQGGLDAQFGMHRWQDVLGYTVLSIPALVAYWGQPWFGVVWFGLLKFALMVALFDLDMVMAQDFGKPWKVLWRFGTAPLLVVLITGWWPAAFVGVVLAIGTWALKKWGGRVPFFLPYWDGWEAGWELMIGGVTGLAWVLAPVLGGPCAIG